MLIDLLYLNLKFVVGIRDFMGLQTVDILDGVVSALVPSWALVAGVVDCKVSKVTSGTHERILAKIFMMCKFLAGAALGIWSNMEEFLNVAHFVEQGE